MEAEKAGFHDKGQMGQSLSAMAKRGELGHPAPVNPSTDGSRPGLWQTATVSTGAHRQKDGSMTDKLDQQVKNWATPDASDRRSDKSKQVGLSNQTKTWATPSTMDHLNVVRTPQERSPAANKGGCKNLREEVHQWATQRSKDAEDWMMNKARLAAGKPEDTLTGQVTQSNKSNGKLNPRWVETLMGLPVGWTMPSCASPVTIVPTNSDCWETESYPQPQNEHSELF
jgi:hypothetical protein